VADGDPCVLDASVLVDLATRRRGWRAVAAGVAGRPLHAPAHVDVEVMSAIARLQRAGVLTVEEAAAALDRFAAAPLHRHELPPLVSGAWGRLGQLRVADALYVELASQLGMRVLTSDVRLARASDLASLVPE
jgi:predicted nucleic acid-binding protein